MPKCLYHFGIFYLACYLSVPGTYLKNKKKNYQGAYPANKTPLL
jgi:hypothetical protein